MKISAAVVSLFLLSITAVPDTQANEVGFYTGLSVGQSSKESDKAEFDAFAFDIYDFFSYTPATIQSSFDDKDTSFVIVVGYRLTPYIAFEGAYAKLGELAYRSRSSGSFRNDQGTLDANISSETTGFEVSVLGILPLSRDWELFGRAGALFATNRLEVTLGVRGEIFANPGGERTSDAFSKSTTDTFAGIGVSRRFFDAYDFRLEYQRVFRAGLESTGGEGDIDVALLGLTITF